MSRCLEDQKPQHSAPQPPCWGFSFGSTAVELLNYLTVEVAVVAAVDDAASTMTVRVLAAVRPDWSVAT